MTINHILLKFEECKSIKTSGAGIHAPDIPMHNNNKPKCFKTIFFIYKYYVESRNDRKRD